MAVIFKISRWQTATVLKINRLYYVMIMQNSCAFSALTLLVGQQEEIWTVKTEWWGAGVVICLERGAYLHMAQLMPLQLTVSCFI